MIVKADAKALEWRCKAALAMDKVAIEEILNNEDQHTKNQQQFGLPSRLIAKIFVYRMIFANSFGDNGFEGPAYAYANDPDFSGVSSSKKYWVSAVEKFYKKYEGMYEHSLGCIREATSTGRITNPNGRFYPFEPRIDSSGRSSWPLTNILNYPVQGIGADIMREVRLAYWERLHTEAFGGGTSSKYKLINTVHDDVQTDAANEKPTLIYLRQCLHGAFGSIQPRMKAFYDYELPVPMECEIKIGHNLHEDSMVDLDEYIANMV